MNTRSATQRGLDRNRFTNFTTGSKTGPPPWSVPMSVNTNDPDMSTSDPYVSGFPEPHRSTVASGGFRHAGAAAQKPPRSPDNLPYDLRLCSSGWRFVGTHPEH